MDMRRVIVDRPRVPQSRAERLDQIPATAFGHLIERKTRTVIEDLNHVASETNGNRSRPVDEELVNRVVHQFIDDVAETRGPC